MNEAVTNITLQIFPVAATRAWNSLSFSTRTATTLVTYR